MSSIKIITVLKHDTLPEIMELFRQAPSGEVIFVLSKTGSLFSREDHFAAFASEAATGGKTITLLTSNPTVTPLAHKYKFGVMAAGKAPAPATLAKASFATDDALQDFNDAAVQDDDGVVPTSDQITHAPLDEEQEALEGFRIVNPDGIDDEPGEDADTKEPSDADIEDAELMASGNDPILAQLASAVDGVQQGASRRSVRVIGTAPKKAVPVQIQTADIPSPEPQPTTAPSAPTVPATDSGDLDYIDAVWRDKVAQTPQAATPPTPLPSMSEQPVPVTHRSFRFALPRQSFHIGSKRMLAAIVGISIALLAGALFIVSGSARVHITPVGRSLDLRLQVQASDTFTAVDATFVKIPGQRISVTKTASKTVPATGSRDVASKARGSLTVSNAYSSTPQTLIATTRFATGDGKIFRSLQTIVVPGSTIKNGSVVPGTIRVDVIADRPGTEYNVPAGAFTIVAFTERGDTDRASKITAQSEGAMTGGASGPSKVITKTDYDSAYADALKEATAAVADAIKTQGSDLTVLQADTPTVSETKATAHQDDAADETTVTVTVQLTTVAFRAGDLAKLVADTTLQKERLAVDEQFSTVATSDISFDPATNILSFTAVVTGTGFQPIDQAAIVRDIVGKNSGQVRDYFQSRDDIRSATVELTPFWISKVPRNPESTHVTVIHQANP